MLGVLRSFLAASAVVLAFTIGYYVGADRSAMQHARDIARRAIVSAELCVSILDDSL